MNAGEASEHYEGRFDLEAYPALCKTLQNFTPMIQGPAERRSGSIHIAEVKDSASGTWLVSYRRSRAVSFVLEFGDNYVRFYYQRGLVLSGAPVTPTAITQADPAVVTSAAHGLANGQDIFIQSVGGMTELNGRFFRVANQTTNTFELVDTFDEDVDSTGFTAFTSGGSIDTPLEVASPYDAAALTLDNGEFGLDIAQSNDVLYICDKRGVLKPRKLIRSDTTTWSFEELDYDDGPFLPLNTGDEIMTISDASIGTGRTVWASSRTQFTQADVGRLIYIEQENLDAVKPWKDGQASIAVGERLRSEGHQYIAENSGTTGVTTPNHVRGVASDGTIRWQYETSNHGIARITAVDADGGDKATIEVLTQFPETVAIGAAAGATDTISTISQANPCVVTTSAAHGLSDGNVIYITSAGGMDEIEGRFFQVNNASGSTFELQTLAGGDVDSTSFTAHSSGGTVTLHGGRTLTGDSTTYAASKFPSVLWKMGAFGGSRGYPTSVSFFLDRLCYAVENEIYCSVSGDFDSFYENEFGEIVDTSAFRVPLNSDQINEIVSLLAGPNALYAYTEGAEWTIGRASEAEPFGPNNNRPAEQTAYGSRPVKPIRVGEAVLFMTATGEKIRELLYDISVDSLLARDMTVRANHIMRGGATYMVWQNEPRKSLMVGRKDGQLLNFSYDRDQSVLGWGRWVYGGVSAAVKSSATIASPNNDRDDVYSIVQRTVNGVTKQYVEYHAPEHRVGDALEDAVYVDSAVTWTGAATSVIPGFHHLVGETLRVLADGGDEGELTVAADGTITISSDAEKVTAGYGFLSVYTSFRLLGGAADGTNMGKKERVIDQMWRVLETRGGSAGAVDNVLDEISKIADLNNRNPATPMGQAEPLFTGDAHHRPKTKWTTEPRAHFETDDPFPATLLGVYPQVDVRENRRGARAA
ncbi:MAG: hypothetical protein ACPGQD_00995 [Planctomycetota bacterium]